MKEESVSSTGRRVNEEETREREREREIDREKMKLIWKGKFKKSLQAKNSSPCREEILFLAYFYVWNVFFQRKSEG